MRLYMETHWMGWYFIDAKKMFAFIFIIYILRSWMDSKFHFEHLQLKSFPGIQAPLSLFFSWSSLSEHEHEWMLCFLPFQQNAIELLTDSTMTVGKDLRCSFSWAWFIWRGEETGYSRRICLDQLPGSYTVIQSRIASLVKCPHRIHR